MKAYTIAELLEIVTSNANPEVRRIAGNMLYSTGKRDQATEDFSRRFSVDEVAAAGMVS